MDMIDSVRGHEYILMDALYDSSHINDYVFENTHAIIVIDTNKRWVLLSISWQSTGSRE
jgi:hypothetical protein